MNNKEWKKWLFWFTLGLAIVVAYKTIDSVNEILIGIKNLIKLLMPFLLAIILAYILYIPSKKIEERLLKAKSEFIKKKARVISIALVYVILVILIFLVINVVIPAISTSVIDLANNIPNYYNSAIKFFEELDDDSILAKINMKEYVNSLNKIDIPGEIIKWANLENISSVLGSLLGATNIIFDTFVTVVVSIYMLLERNDIKNFISNFAKAVLDEKVYDCLAKYYAKTNSIFFTFISSQVIDGIIVGIVTSIAMSLMKVKYGVLLGVLIGLFNVIPYFGAIIAVTIAIIITIFTGGVTQAIWLAIVVIALQQIDANIINPKILGTNLNLSPILVIFAVTVGGAYFGVLGMFLGVPVLAFIKLVLQDFVTKRNENKELVKQIESLEDFDKSKENKID